MERKHKKYLDKLRESGETNMFGAVPYIQGQFGISKQVAKIVLLEWMGGDKHKTLNNQKLNPSASPRKIKK